MVKVCCCCSKVDLNALEQVVPAEKLVVGCIDQCQGFDGKTFGEINGEVVVAESSEAFIEAVKANI